MAGMVFCGSTGVTRGFGPGLGASDTRVRAVTPPALGAPLTH